MNKLLELIGRDASLFQEDLGKHEAEMCAIIQNGRFLVIGGAGTIGSAVVRELFRRDPKLLHVVDISENNLAELVRDLRSSSGYIKGEFRTFALDCGSDVFDAMAEAHGPYDYILNFSALKHVRSESDPFTLMRMIDVNIFNTDKTLRYATESGAKKYFCVSTDKASNPVNMMGASKCIMESFLMRRSEQIPVSTARFANVAFSDGSLPFAWTQRIRKQQPIAAPNDVRRYFVTDQEGAILCLMSTFFGNNRDLFFPKLSAKLHLEKFSEIAKRYLQSIGYEAYECDSEEEARAKVSELSAQGKWPCFFFKSDTTGEKDFEEFFTDEELVDWDRFHDIGVVQANRQWDDETLNHFERYINELKTNGVWEKEELVDLFNQTLTRF
ncbi:MAG TPA: NAD-dependent epimerase/dehydratase family protein, partial [Verrucomicrobia bacterium]|nr:NAD-dependent epimerase/dehydratase family protein [Verrucomicrobiota bacterium]